jgi:hypothetical protein
MAPLFAIIPYALLETFFCIPILPKTNLEEIVVTIYFFAPSVYFFSNTVSQS